MSNEEETEAETEAEDATDDRVDDWAARPRFANAEFSADTESPLPVSESAVCDANEAVDSLEMKSGKRNENMPKPPGMRKHVNEN